MVLPVRDRFSVSPLDIVVVACVAVGRACVRPPLTYGDHTYGDKAPGVSLLALPAFEAMRNTGRPPSPPETRGLWESSGVAPDTRHCMRRRSLFEIVT
jgi:hypothetical protein